jgi:hypothetical protein
MRKSFIAIVLLVITIFGTGYVLGQVLGISPVAAATSTPTTTQPGARFHGMVGGSPHADGTVTGINGNTVTIKADADNGNGNEYTNVTTIQVTSSTQYATSPNSSSSAGKSSITVGSYILAEGTVSSDGKTLTATSVQLLPAGAHAGCPGQSGTTQSTPSA